jgi:hypothetical protein
VHETGRGKDELAKQDAELQAIEARQSKGVEDSFAEIEKELSEPKLQQELDAIDLEGVVMMGGQRVVKKTTALWEFQDCIADLKTLVSKPTTASSEVHMSLLRELTAINIRVVRLVLDPSVPVPQTLQVLVRRVAELVGTRISRAQLGS